MELPQFEGWLSDVDFQLENPIVCTIRNIKSVEAKSTKGGTYTDFRLSVEKEGGKIRTLSLFGDNYRKLFDAYGNDSDKWIGHIIKITKVQTANGKNLKEVAIVK